MKSPYEFRNINVGDLLIQQIINPLKSEEFIRRRGIIVNIQNNISTIEWTLDGENPSTDLSKTSIINSSLRKMILDGYILHYPIQK
jgi:hypothetical protein